jgi:hypothetical protein
MSTFRNATTFNKYDTTVSAKGKRIMVKNGVRQRCAFVLSVFEKVKRQVTAGDVFQALQFVSGNAYKRGDVDYAITKLVQHELLVQGPRGFKAVKNASAKLAAL